MSFSTWLLDEILQKKRDNLEIIRKELIKKLLEMLKIFHEQKYFENAIVFGSIINANKFNKESDIDIAFTGLSDENFFRFMSILSSELQWDVDIIQLEKCSFKEKIIREGIEWTKIST